jgi:rSAM-partnered protein
MTDDGPDESTTDDWHRVDAPRADETREWEVFLRDAPDDDLTHAGSVSAPSAALAHEQASSLFGHAATTIWLCPADETRRFGRRRLGGAHDTDGGEDEYRDEATTAGGDAV